MPASRNTRDLQLPDADLGRHGRDRLAGRTVAITNQVPLCRCSYGPHARAMVRICKEESFHQRQGFESLLISRGTPARRRWPSTRSTAGGIPAWPCSGRQDSQSTHTGKSMAWGIKRFSNDELRQKFVDMTVPQSHVLGLTIPDPELRWNEQRHYDFTCPDWASCAG